MNFQSVAEVRGIQGLLLSLLMAARALVTIGSLSEEEEIFLARAVSMARI